MRRRHAIEPAAGRVPRRPAVWAAAIKDVAQAYHFPTLLLPLLLLVVMGFGSYDSMHDARGDRMLGALPMFAPAVLSIWWSIRGAFMKEPSIGRLLARIYSGAYGSIPLILGGMLTTAVGSTLAGAWVGVIASSSPSTSAAAIRRGERMASHFPGCRHRCAAGRLEEGPARGSWHCGAEVLVIR